MQAIQYTETFDGGQRAWEALQALKAQVGCLGGRIVDLHTVQAFFEATGLNQDTPLPDGMRFVVIPESATKLLGIERPEVIDGLDAKERAMVAVGDVIPAIKELRNRTSKTLQEARDTINLYIARHGQGVRS
jgi:hypothetical protein